MEKFVTSILHAAAIGWRAVIAGAFLLVTGQSVLAQEGNQNYIYPLSVQSKDCFPGINHTSGKSATGSPQAAARPNPNPNPGPGQNTFSSVNGVEVTPKGNLKVLVIFAGFEEEALVNCPSQNATSWPSEGPFGFPVRGNTFPADINDVCYTSNTQFSPTANDESLSNFYYKMSQTAANPFRMTFGYFPDRINIPAATGNNMGTCTQAVLNKIAADYPDFDWSPYDQRTNHPDFAFDNSTSQPDGALDYVVVCFRTFKSCGVTLGTNSGVAGGTAVQFPATTTRPRAYRAADGHTQSGGSLGRELFLHEFAHNLYNAPHLLGANNTFGSRLNYTHGWGMMANFYTMYSANAWERWYNGWTELRTGATLANSDVQNAASLAATNGSYTLRNYMATGDVIRVRIPGSNQYIWLENRSGDLTTHDHRRGYRGLGPDGTPYPDGPHGLVMMTEDLGERTNPWNILGIFDPNKVNGLRVLSAAGNFDYVATGSFSTYNNHLGGIGLFNYLNPMPNPTGGSNEISTIRADNTRNGSIAYDNASGNGDGNGANGAPDNEFNFMGVINSTLVDGYFGPNIWTKQVGFRLGLDTNPLPMATQTFNQTTDKLSVIKLSGLSIEVTNFAPNGDITVQVRYNDTDLTRDTRWTGELLTTPVANTPSGYAVNVMAGATLTLNRSRTVQRTNAGPLNDFVWPTVLTVAAGAPMLVKGGTVVADESGTTIYVADDAHFDLKGGSLVMNEGTVLSLNQRNDLGDAGGVLVLKVGSQLIIRSTGQVIPGTQRGAGSPKATAYPNPATGEVTFGWPQGTPPASLAGSTYELQTPQGLPVRQGRCLAPETRLQGVAPGVYLLTLRAGDGTRQVQRVAVH